MRLRGALPIGVFLVSGALFAAPQTPTFRSQTNFVEVDAIVADKSGAFVAGLTADDFEIKENYSLQTVSAFSYLDLGAGSTTAPVRFRSDVPANERIDATRIYLLFLDGVPAEYLSLARRQAGQFVRDFLQGSDLAAVWHSRQGRVITITSDKPTLLGEIAAQSGGASAPGRQSANLRSAIDWMGGVQGRRKSLILFTSGMAQPPASVALHTYVRTTGLEEALVLNQRAAFGGNPRFDGRELNDLVARSDVHIYPVDARGLAAPTPIPAGYDSGVSALDPIRTNPDNFLASTMQLQELADLTGGLALINSNDYAPGFKRVVDDNSRYYLLGYNSTSTARSREFRKLDVKVTRPGLTVRARKGFVRW